jgi:hypothetical protein
MSLAWIIQPSAHRMGKFTRIAAILGDISAASMGKHWD